MEPEDLIIEFHKLIQKINKNYQKNISEMDNLARVYEVETTGPMVIHFPFKHEVYFGGYKCLLEMSGTITMIT